MRYLSFILLTVLLSSADWLHSQTPQIINYQAVARDGDSGGELVNQSVEVLFKILNNGPGGDIVYQETHSSQTNAFGLVNLQIGGGDVDFGSMEDIDWGVGQKWLVVEMDLGEGFEEVSSSRFISVPYALHAEVAGTAVDVDDADPDPTNELIDTLVLTNTLLQTYEGGFPDGHVNSVDLSSLIDDADSDPTNELIDTLLLINNVLHTYEGGFPDGHLNTIDLSELINDADSDPTNELIDPDNTQLIDTLLYISEGGITHIINLADLANYGPWQVGNGTVFNTDAYIGIGTAEPEHKLEVLNNSTNAEDSVTVFAQSQNSVVTSYGVAARVEGASENRAIYGDAPGNSGVRWAGYFDRGDVYVSNKLAVNEANPHSRVHTNGSVAGSVRFELSTNGNIELQDEDYMLIVDVSNGQGSVTLPPATTCEGRIYYIKRTYDTPTNNTLQIGPTAGDNIDGTAFPILLSSTSARESRMLVSAGVNGWFVMSE